MTFLPCHALFCVKLVLDSIYGCDFVSKLSNFASRHSEAPGIRLEYVAHQLYLDIIGQISMPTKELLVTVGKAINGLPHSFISSLLVASFLFIMSTRRADSSWSNNRVNRSIGFTMTAILMRRPCIPPMARMSLIHPHFITSGWRP